MLISKLIVPPNIEQITPIKISEPLTQNNPTVKKYAELFVSGMGTNQKERFKKMLELGVDCGKDVAKVYGVPVEEFIIEVKRII